MGGVSLLGANGVGADGTTVGHIQAVGVHAASRSTRGSLHADAVGAGRTDSRALVTVGAGSSADVALHAFTILTQATASETFVAIIVGVASAVTSRGADVVGASCADSNRAITARAAVRTTTTSLAVAVDAVSTVQSLLTVGVLLAGSTATRDADVVDARVAVWSIAV